jgi:peptidoglycan/LPS O-acetylase OafA/YrhL
VPTLNKLSKPHYPILDGLRGTAALLVVIYHLFEAYYPVVGTHPIPHGYLAVDFFYLLSGFVVGYAYDDRWGKMNIKQFFTIRLIRLHPLVILGVFIGLVCFLLDPFRDPASHVSAGKLIIVTLISLTLLPSPDIRGWGETHSLNGPAWSLYQEYIANVIYALFGRKMSKLVLWIIVIFGAVLLTYTAVWNGHVGTGWSYETYWIAQVRMLFPFFAGLLLFRTGKLIHIPMAYSICSLALIILFIIPAHAFYAWYEAACIIIAFPIIVAAGAGGQVSGRWAKVCNFAGAISYPIYILHYPFIYIYTEWVYYKKPAPAQIVPVAIALFFFFILLAWAALKYYDAPVRAWLKKKYIDK